jgi:hypothetical protein
MRIRGAPIALLGLALVAVACPSSGSRTDRRALRLRLDATTADDATGGWDGGVYRAWTNGTDVAVVMDTAWDSGADAAVFGAAVGSWNDHGNAPSSVTVRGTHVTLLFATAGEVLARLDAALART